MAQPIISLIAAVAKNGVIGCKNDLPWHIPADLKHFKTLTTGKPCLMGRKTHQSIAARIPSGLLPNRQNIILTRQADFKVPVGAFKAESIESALAYARADEIMVIGGTGIYTLALPRAGRLYLTRVDAEPEGDAFFPDIDWKNWEKISSDAHAAEGDTPAYTFEVWEKI